MEQEKMQELLKKRLKEKGLKVTRQRLLVLSVLETARFISAGTEQRQPYDCGGYL